MKQSLVGILMGAAVCLIGAPTLGRYTSTVAASPSTQAQTAAAPVETAAAVVETPQVPAVVRVQAEPVDVDPMDLTDAEASGISPTVLRMALDAVTCAVTTGEIAAPPTLTVIDYSLPSTEARLWVFETATGQLLYKELVAHGKNSGENRTTRFSDELNSLQSSIGLFVTGETYVGSNGYSLRLTGLEPGFNGRARERAIVMHGAPYVDAKMAAKQGRLGRSWGCPAVREAVARDIIDTVDGGSVIFSYYPDERWLETSRFLNCGDRALLARS